jgi:hypothetical protein
LQQELRSTFSGDEFSGTLQDVDNLKRKIVILEVGCGLNVPTVREHNENFVSVLGDCCTFIRVNPEYPLVGKEVQSRFQGAKVINLLSRGLETITEINACLFEMDS